ncbi:MAG TPA: hypothetical protein HA254_00540 [Candidatus Diapherotrites archaeon]|uniref:Uncharacterized protein n=1 Tax=Candidatus Iainarchaeum sp. TaxID=3101447 RepID=A0A7J4IZA8_9ARCH|nr:hypothetical protein [Candidatus Diapherotrites archaeon]
MYPEGAQGGAAAGAEEDYGAPLQQKLGTHLEGLIPIILILIIGIFLAIRFDVIDSSTPVLGNLVDVIQVGKDKTRVLIIGQTSQEVIDILNDNRDRYEYQIKTTQTLERNPVEQLATYKIVMLDQSEEANKEVSKKLGEAIQRFVKNGGKFILVKDSGIRRPDTFDVIGWKNTFGDVVPVECDRVENNQPTCTNRYIVSGKLYREDERHPILKGIEIFPADPLRNATFESFDVSVSGKEIAYIQSGGIDKKTFPAVVEKNLVIGKSIYFNYNPGITRGIFESTLEYLR